MDSLRLVEEDFLACCGSTKFAAEMAKAKSQYNLTEAVEMSREIWFNKIDVHGWLEAFSAHPQIGDKRVLKNSTETAKEWSEGEQSVAMNTATDSTLQELAQWNKEYKEKFGFIFLICASGKSTSEILEALKTRMSNRPVVEMEIAGNEQQRITELRLSKLFAEKCDTPTVIPSKLVKSLQSEGVIRAGRRLENITLHLASASVNTQKSPSEQTSSRTRPPITTHVLDVSCGKPGAGIEVSLEYWKGPEITAHSCLSSRDSSMWSLLGSSSTDSDGRCASLMPVMNLVPAGMYRITFNTGKYYADHAAIMPGADKKVGFYPYVSLVFEIKPSQKCEHFHVPLLLSPFSFTTYRGS